ncbi:MAG TPA: 2-dehydropantoate 2-reductase [Candidatus Acidoferrales bacterium]|nr:2-dehydropantoate 2-reductase [Candidatus Acidoferrales bacterium]
MTAAQTWPRVAVVGAGAVGGYFGGMFARAGAPVILIGRKAFVEAVQHEGLLLDAVNFRERVRVEASTEIAAARGADLVLFCVKTTDNRATAQALAPALSHRAAVVSLQNGVENAAELRAAANIEALAAAVYVAASVPAPGHIKHVARGDLVIGPPGERTASLAEIFVRAGIPCRVSENIQGELWKKLIWNCALNAISALGRARYVEVAESAEARRTVRAAVEEVFAVARAAGIILPGVETPEAAMDGAMKIATQMKEARSSTAQDLQRGRRTEIDSLNGYISRSGAELGVPTPVNQALFALVTLAERSGGHSPH